MKQKVERKAYMTSSGKLVPAGMTTVNKKPDNLPTITKSSLVAEKQESVQSEHDKKMAAMKAELAAIKKERKLMAKKTKIVNDFLKERSIKLSE